ncbi:thioesterase II family protein [Streptomyces inusitatus]|nr:alpha/beta fold hydrolase [Streptomyces inusitatus]
MRIFCLPHAGGSAARLAATLAPWIEGARPEPLEPSGRGERWREPPCPDWPTACHDLAERLTALTGSGEPYGLLGHSLGALYAHELAVRAQDRARPPALLIVTGRRPPHESLRAVPHTAELPELSDEELYARVVALGGAPARGAGPLTYRMFLPVLRGDLRIADAYRPVPQKPLSCPLLALHGTDDPLAPGGPMRGWRGRTTGEFALRQVPGGHFFPYRAPAGTGAAVGRFLARIPDGA